MWHKIWTLWILVGSLSTSLHAEGELLWEDCVWIGMERNGVLGLEQSCQPGKCEDLKFPIEYLSCDTSFHPSDSEYHLSFTIGNRYYDFLNVNKNEKHLSIEYDGTIKPQIRNGFDLYLVPPPQ
ncbi:hypothetical protein [Leptospira perdikensis]|uniref:Uncharacterized protein n=1 Tax=Leptospira perdikensis TaxID=2484948 RepID=A0A4V3JPM5_9LEPT|nr:hypothetical protein [Leptospira perdikensis]TGL45129.1 hypothetical protein EHQ49_06640 [Leptospira perdikensis]